MGARSPARWLAAIGALSLAVLLGVAVSPPARAQGTVCPPGFEWQRMSGVGCVQANCFEVAAGVSRLGYTGNCICQEQYQACYEPVDYSAFDRAQCGPFCPVSRLVACVQPGQACPGTVSAPEPTAPPSGEPGASEIDLEQLLAGGQTVSPTPGQIAGASIIAVTFLGGCVLAGALAAWRAGGRAVTSQTPGRPSIAELYNAARDNYRQCQDLPWAHVTGSPPPAGAQSKSALHDKMVQEGYWEASQGGMYDPQGLAAKLSDLRDGDIIMLDTGGLPNARDANHYAVVENGRIYQILNLPKGGEPDVMDVGEAMSFFGRRQVRSVADGKVYDCAAYYGVRVFRRPAP